MHHLRLLALLSGLLALACADDLRFEVQEDGHVLLPSKYVECQDDDACTITGVSCTRCCEVEAVRSSIENEVYNAVERSCAKLAPLNCGCLARPREARCIEGRCTLLHESTSCGLEGKVVADQGDVVPDPFSCNSCVCQRDGTLRCDTAACPRPCSAGMRPGVTCDVCGYNENCDQLRTACLPECDTSADCGGTIDGVCLDGVCKRTCGRPPT
jgi:hypothetical protein